MTNYRAMFLFKNLPSFEVLFVYGNETIKYTGPPGIVALNLANTLVTKENSITDIMNKFSYPESDFIEQTVIGPLIYISKLDKQRSIMDSFIKTVFISQSKNDTLEEALSNDERITHYFKNEKHESIVKDAFSALSIKPFFNMPGNYEIKNDHLEIEDNEVKNINLFVTDKPKLSLETHNDPKNSLIASDNKLFFTWDYESNNLITVAWLELLLMADAGVKIKNCHKCNAYFSPFPPNTLHCEKCRENHTAQTLYRERVKQRIEQLPPIVREELLNDEREKSAEYMREYRKKKRLSQKQNKSK